MIVTHKLTIYHDLTSEGVMTRLEMAQAEIRKHDFDTFVDEPPSVAQGVRESSWWVVRTAARVFADSSKKRGDQSV
jgi:hypothetical protein